jgi:hypothetical protein
VLLDECATLGIALFSPTLACRLNIYGRNSVVDRTWPSGGCAQPPAGSRSSGWTVRTDFRQTGRHAAQRFHVPKPRRFRVQPTAVWVGRREQEAPTGTSSSIVEQRGAQQLDPKWTPSEACTVP